jgi:hypothetical protein
MEGGIDAAATPNVAEGGAVDVFRGLQGAEAGRQARKLAEIQPFVKAAQGYGYRARGDAAIAGIGQGQERIEETGRHNRRSEDLTASGQGETGRHNQATEGLTKSGQGVTERGNFYRASTAGIPYGMGTSFEGFQKGEAMAPVADENMSPTQKAINDARKASTEYTGQLTKQSVATQTATEKSTSQADAKMELEERRVQALEARAKAAVDKARQDAQSQGALNPKQFQMATKLGNDLNRDPAYKKMLDVEDGIRGVQSGINQKNGLGDITAINAFQRMVDTGATVRAEDVKLIQAAIPWFKKILSTYPIDHLETGAQLPESVRAQMLKIASELYGIRAEYYNQNVVSRYKMLAESQGIPFDYVGRELPQMNQPGPGPAAGGGAVPITSGGATYSIPPELMDQFKASHPDAQVMQ